MTPDSAPRLLVTDTLGQRIIAIDKPTLTLGRRSETVDPDSVEALLLQGVRSGLQDRCLGSRLVFL